MICLLKLNINYIIYLLYILLNLDTYHTFVKSNSTKDSSGKSTSTSTLGTVKGSIPTANSTKESNGNTLNLKKKGLRA